MLNWVQNNRVQFVSEAYMGDASGPLDDRCALVDKQPWDRASVAALDDRCAAIGESVALVGERARYGYVRNFEAPF